MNYEDTNYEGTSMISIIAAIGKNRELGKNNKLLWNIPSDMKRFRTLTAGHPVIMGRKTFESIGRPLQGRTNIVVSHQTDFLPEGITVKPSLEEAITYAHTIDTEEIFIIGGAQIYEQAIGIANQLYLTLIDQTFDADAFFPDYSRFGTILESKNILENGLHVTFLTLIP